MLFDDIYRDYNGPRGHTESLYEYLNRSARSSLERIRVLMENWFANFPLDSEKEFETRFCSTDDVQHQSAFFELYLAALLSKLGFEIEIHPRIHKQSTHPEFLVLNKGEPAFYLEATLAIGPEDERAAAKRENEVYKTIDKMDTPNFFIGVKVHGSPNTPPPGRKWRNFLENWLSSLDPDAIGKRMKSNGFEDLPNVSRNHDGWNVTFQAIPKSPAARGKKGIRPIGIRFFGFHECKEDEWIRNAVKEKATKYGKLDLPYIIAINVISDFFEDFHMVMDALFGDEGFTFNHKLERAPNGAFFGPQGPQNTRVSGVIICNYLLWGNIGKINPVLWHNPWGIFAI
jgi:hypothetical protein